MRVWPTAKRALSRPSRAATGPGLSVPPSALTRCALPLVSCVTQLDHYSSRAAGGISDIRWRLLILPRERGTTAGEQVAKSATWRSCGVARGYDRQAVRWELGRAVQAVGQCYYSVTPCCSGDSRTRAIQRPPRPPLPGIQARAWCACPSQPSAGPERVSPLSSASACQLSSQAGTHALATTNPNPNPHPTPRPLAAAMSRFVRQSSYRHTFGTPAKKEKVSLAGPVKGMGRGRGGGARPRLLRAGECIHAETK